MKNLNLFLFLILSTGILFSACKKEEEEDSNIPVLLLYGWAAGTSDGHYGTIIHTKDGGKNWIRQGDSIQLPSVGFRDVCILDTNNILVVGDSIPDGRGHNVYRSSDGGQTWSMSGTGLPNVNYNGIYAFDYNNIWIVGDKGTIYYSADGGFSWTKKDVPAEFQNIGFLRVCASAIDNIWIGGYFHPADSFPVLLHSTDMGGTWQRVHALEDLGMDQTKLGHFLSIKVKGNSIWAMGGPGKFIIRSVDNGATWNDVSVSPAYADANDIYLLSEDAAYIVEDYGEFYRTTDGGQSWTQYNVNTNNWLVGIAVLFDYKIWVCGNAGGSFEYSVIKYSPDGGKTWNDQTPEFMKNNIGISMYKIRMVAVYN